MRIIRLKHFILVACAVPLLAVGAAAQHSHTSSGQPPASLADAVRQATERFRDVNQTTGANYFPFLGCVAPPEIGNFPPVLNGQTFQFVDFPNRFGIPAFYELHVWAWQDNPKGTFADWNTLVSCDGAVDDGEEHPWL